MKKAIIVFGSTGNLMYKKLIPALNELIKKKHLDESTGIFCMARRDYDINTYVAEAKKHVTEKIDWNKLEPFLSYNKIDVYKDSDYSDFLVKLQEEGYEEFIVYLAVPPSLFPVISKGISDSGIINKDQLHNRIVFEKPFGEDLESAKSINKELWQYFDEKQIYRIDHYLGKEMIQNILTVRFANVLLENSWSFETIENIWIVAKEAEGVMSRGGYYDSIGALKDMLQSHLLQMASLIAMEKPVSYESSDIKDKKVEVLKDMKIAPKDVIFGQYRGYLNEEKVNEKSSTETFVFAEARINNDRFRGVPIYFITGKKLGEKRSEIIVNFKSNPNQINLWPEELELKNQLRIEVAPKEGVIFQLNVKEPGLDQKIIPAKLDYCHNCKALENTPEAYEKLLLDLLNRNKTLFTRWDEIETTWQIVDKLKKTRKQLYIYDSYEDIREEIKKQFGEEFHDL